MVTISLHKIVFNILLRRRYSIHWYMDFIIPAKDCLRQLSLDGEIECINICCLPLNSNHAIDMPNDYVDYVQVGYRNGQYIQPLVEDNSLSLIPNYDSDFDIQSYTSGVATEPTIPTFNNNRWSTGYWWTVNWNNFGENLGRQFGGVGGMADTFRVDKIRKEIKINEAINLSEVVLIYSGSGMDANSATQIDIQAQDTIEAYCLWQFKENNRTYSDTAAALAKQEYIDQRKILRARKSDLSINTLRRIIQKNNIAVKY